MCTKEWIIESENLHNRVRFILCSVGECDDEPFERLFMLLIVVADDLYPRSVIIIEEKKMVFSVHSDGRSRKRNLQRYQ